MEIKIVFCILLNMLLSSFEVSCKCNKFLVFSAYKILKVFKSSFKIEGVFKICLKIETELEMSFNISSSRRFANISKSNIRK